MKIARIPNYGYSFKCPGCYGHTHIIPTKPDSPDGWDFNGDLERPTFTPSLLNTLPKGHTYPGGPPERCHLWVRDGKIEFCGDSSHGLAGKTVEMVDSSHDSQVDVP